LAPVLAVGVATFGLENMAFAIFLTATIQAIIWRFNWQRYILVAVPVYLVEGLLAGVGLKIALKFLAFTYELPPDMEDPDSFLNGARIQIILISMIGYGLFVYLFLTFKKTQPAIPYFALIAAGTILAQFVTVPMLSMEDTELKLALPIPHFDSPLTALAMLVFAAMLASIDVIEQVMSNAAIEKIDPLKRKCNSNNSLLAIWIANMGSSFFGAILCGVLVFKVGIFEGLLIALAVHGGVHYMMYANLDKMPGRDIVRRYIDDLKKSDSGDIT